MAAHVVERANLRVNSSWPPRLISIPGSKPELTSVRNKHRNNYEGGSVFPSPSVRFEQMSLLRAPADHSPLGFSIAAIGYGAGVHQLLYPTISA